MARKPAGPIGYLAPSEPFGYRGSRYVTDSSPIGVFPARPPRAGISGTFALAPAGSKTSATQQSSKAPKPFQMPPPANDTKTKELQVLKRLSQPPPPNAPPEVIFADKHRATELVPLFDGTEPNYKDVQQGALNACPVAAILTAAAYTASGRRRIRAMIKSYKGATVTTLKGSNIKGAKGTTGTRYFEVRLGNKSIEVSDVFYTDDSTPGNPIYMDSRAAIDMPVLWPCIIEKAYAKMEGGYEKLNSGLDPLKVWEVLFNVKPKRMDFYKKYAGSVSRSALRSAISRANIDPMIIAFNDITFHGVAVLGLKISGRKKPSSTVRCWDRSIYTSRDDPEYTFDELYKDYEPVFIQSRL